jgi:hypothetical protein
VAGAVQADPSRDAEVGGPARAGAATGGLLPQPTVQLPSLCQAEPRLMLTDLVEWVKYTAGMLQELFFSKIVLWTCVYNRGVLLSELQVKMIVHWELQQKSTP